MKYIRIPKQALHTEIGVYESWYRFLPHSFAAFGIMSAVSVAESVPEPNDWSALFPRLRLAQPINVAMPCCGIDGAGWALKAMQVQFRANNIYDLEHRYAQYLQTFLEKQSSAPHLGKQDGNVLAVELTNVERPVHLLVAGPPCPPWAGNGNHRGADDERAKVFLHIVKMMAALIKSGELQATVLENVKGILNRQKGEKSFMTKLVAILQEEIPEFVWDVQVLKAKDFLLAQDRTRVFLRGLRLEICDGAIPPPLQPLGTRSLKDFLAQGVAPVDRSKLTACMKQNLKDAQSQLQKLLVEGSLSKDDIVCFPLDRADGKIYKRQICIDRVPTLTTSNSYLFISDLKLEARDEDRDYFRFLLPEERFVLQGFPKKIAGSFNSNALQVQASGNAYPVPLIGAALHGMLQCIGALPAQQNKLESPQSLCQKLDAAMYGTPKKRPAAACKERANKKQQKGTAEARPDPSSSGHAETSPSLNVAHGMKRPAAAKPKPKPKQRMAKTMPPAAPKAWRVRGFFSSSSSSS